jgi:hypothetical protein
MLILRDTITPAAEDARDFKHLKEFLHGQNLGFALFP